MTATGPGNTENLVQSLGGISTMYGLSRGELEKLVAQVVREEGFVNLLRDLDSLWAVKGYLAR
ncbi:hypothetical protein CERSUDRAFT_114201 [Gelatoporia subvermispora B]|uniref:Uncharacterized protein n=1 Tax=Ceriporiopsis subvermispora (strain B) TaxID=914234 RepID=M2QZE8_CERS8|nr:hypothetical protein CERSUDRAFT_114201 [Gelatoporia subvermispora B]